MRERISCTWQGRLLIVSLSLSAFLSLNCFKDPLTPVAPKWAVDLALPVASRTVTVGEMLDRDTSMLQNGPGNQLVLSGSASVRPMFVGDQIAIAPKEVTTQIRLGTVSVFLKPITAPVNISALPAGVIAIVPPLSMNCPGIASNSSVGGTLSFRSGDISLTLRNNLPVAIFPTSPVQIVDENGGVEASFDFGGAGIPANSSRTAYDSLADRTLTNSIGIQGLNFSTPGSGNVPVAIPADSLLVVTVATSNLRACGATIAGIPAQQLVENKAATFPLLDSTLVQELDVKRGALKFTFSNQVHLDIVLRFALQEFLRRVGGQFVPYEDSIALPAMGIGTYTLDLAGMRLRSQTGDLLRTVELIGSMEIPHTVAEEVSVRDTDKVLISMTPLGPLIADTVAAVLKPTWIDVNSVVAVNFGSNSKKFTGELIFPSASLVFTARSTIDYPVDVSLTLAARRSGGNDSVFLSMPAGQRRLQPGTTRIVFDDAQVGAFFSAFAGVFPDSLRVFGSILVNPPDVYNPSLAGVGSVGSNCSFSGSVDVKIPMRLSIVGGTYRDTVAFGGTDEDTSSGDPKGREQLKDVNSGTLFVNVQNTLPVTARITMYLLDRGGRTVLLTIPQTTGAIEVGGAAASDPGQTATPAQTTAVISLSGREVAQFIPAELVAYTVSFPGTPGGQPVTFKTTDYVHVKAWAQFSYQVNK